MPETRTAPHDQDVCVVCCNGPGRNNWLLSALAVVAQRGIRVVACTCMPEPGGICLHPAASGRVYAAYGCVYVVTALLWLRVVDGIALAATDIVGGLVALVGMGIIELGWGSPV